jgi:predicted permease
MTARERESLWSFVTPGWFATYGVLLHSGRDLDQRDTQGALPVMLVNQAFARRFFPDRDAIGQTAVIGKHAGKPAGPRVIVGVVGDARPSLREQLTPTMYLPLAQWDFPFPVFPRIFINVRPTTGPPLALAPSVSAALRGFAPRLAFEFRTHEEQVGASIAQERLVAKVSGLFALLALLLAGLGLYGITAYAVARRRSEIGIRVALGAERKDIMMLVLGHSLAMTAVGIALGLVAAAAVTRFLEGMLFGVTPLDPATFAGVALLFVVVTTVAASLPARRATTVDPLVALRAE